MSEIGSKEPPYSAVAGRWLCCTAGLAASGRTVMPVAASDRFPICPAAPGGPAFRTSRPPRRGVLQCAGSAPRGKAGRPPPRKAWMLGDEVGGGSPSRPSGLAIVPSIVLIDAPQCLWIFPRVRRALVPIASDAGLEDVSHRAAPPDYKSMRTAYQTLAQSLCATLPAASDPHNSVFSAAMNPRRNF
jgi:hypothetical protein